LTDQFHKEKFVEEITNMVEKFNLNDCDVDESMKKFMSSFKKVIDSQLPLRTSSRKEQKQALKTWISKGILKSIKANAITQI